MLNREAVESIVDIGHHVPTDANAADLLPRLMKLLGSPVAYLRENTLEIL